MLHVFLHVVFTSLDYRNSIIVKLQRNLRIDSSTFLAWICSNRIGVDICAKLNSLGRKEVQIKFVSWKRRCLTKPLMCYSAFTG